MTLDSTVLRAFAKEMNAGAKDTSRPTSHRGTVCDGGTCVKLDGSSIHTPASFAMDAIDGDRVVCEFSDNMLKVVGNLTSPASARTATSFLGTEDGAVVIGNRVDGKLTGTCLRIDNDSVDIYDRWGYVATTLSNDGVFMPMADTYLSENELKLNERQRIDNLVIAGFPMLGEPSIIETRFRMTRDDFWDDSYKRRYDFDSEITLDSKRMFAVRRIELDKKKISASSGSAWTQPIPAVAGLVPVAIVGTYLYNMNTFAMNRCSINGGALTISVYNMKGADVTMSGTSYVDVLYINALIAPDAPTAASED